MPWGPAGAGVPPPVGRLSVGNGASGAVSESLTMVDATGRFVAFTSAAPLVAGDTNDQKDAYVRDRLTDTLERVSARSLEVVGHVLLDALPSVERRLRGKSLRE